MTFVFVDTGAWIALGSDRDRHHPAARKHLASLLDGRTPLVTSNYVVAETATRLRYGGGLQSALKFRTTLDRTAATGQLRMIWIDPRLEAEGWEILRQYPSVQLSLTDATSAAAARHRRIRDVFGFDRDFEALGFTVRPAGP